MKRILNTFTTVQTEGGLLPGDLLARIAAGDRSLDGLTPESYHLAPTERLGEAATRAWTHLQSSWRNFRAAGAKLPAADPGTSATRERWLLPLFQEFGYGRLPTGKRQELQGKSYAISHSWQGVPIHLVGFRVDLDRRAAGVAGAALMSPHGLVQEFLNVSDHHLWGVVSNGLRLRILRDNVSLTRQAYVEFDLEAMMEGEVYSEFVLLWLLLHQSRLEAARPEECWLEQWVRAAQEQGTRALETLRGGVEEAIRALGRGFLAHPANATLRQRLRAGELSTQDYYRQLLRLVYRLIFLLVAEERDLLFDPASGPAARRLYFDFYSMRSLRRLAERVRGTRHSDLFHRVRVVMDQLGSDDGCPGLALPPLGSFLWSHEAIPDLGVAELTNEDFLGAVRALTLTEQERIVRAIDYRNLGSEELGSIYESLLELHPAVNTDGATFELKVAPGHERKTTGSYYTPSSLVQCLLDSALDPVLDQAVATGKDAESAILGLKVCDPACGSGHFLIAAAHRIARRLASVRTGEDEPSPEATRRALREVIGHCLYGVDVNPMAVELCKVSLWMEALEPGKPFSFLEHRIVCGNSLLGATPALVAQGIPDAAFDPIQGDDPKLCSSLRRQNAKERQGESWLYPGLVAEGGAVYDVLASGIASLDDITDDTLPDVRRKEEQHRRLTEAPEYANARLIADAWCAAFVWKKAGKKASPITHDFFLRLTAKPQAVTPAVRMEIERLSAQYRFFHWHLAFPDVFRSPADGPGENPHAGWDGGFDVVLGNPPWERIKIQEKEWFAERRPDVAEAPNAAARRKLIAALAKEDPALYESFTEALRMAEGESHLVRDSGRYPLCGRGDVNTYSVFAETMRMLISAKGRVGSIVPSGIATDDTTKFFFQDLMAKGSLVSLFDFENRKKLFPAVDSRVKFCLVTLAGPRNPAPGGAEFAFFAHQVEDLDDEERRFALSRDDIRLLNPNTLTCPIFRTRRDAEITKGIYERVPVLIDENDPNGNPWGLSFMAMFHMANDSGLFRTRKQLEEDDWELEGNVFHKGRKRHLPLYEAKMVHHFDHRWATYVMDDSRLLTSLEKSDPSFFSLPRYWVESAEVDARLRRASWSGGSGWTRQWLLGWRNVARATDERTAIFSAIPRTAVGHSFPLAFAEVEDLRSVSSLQANLSALVVDYVLRQKLGGTNFTYGYLFQLPILPPSTYQTAPTWCNGHTVLEWLATRVLRLAYTSFEMSGYARDLGYQGTPFSWNDEDRLRIRCEMDAAFFILYDLGQEEVSHILDSFSVLASNELSRYGRHRTKSMVLGAYADLRAR